MTQISISAGRRRRQRLRRTPVIASLLMASCFGYAVVHGRGDGTSDAGLAASSVRPAVSVTPLKPGPTTTTPRPGPTPRHTATHLPANQELSTTKPLGTAVAGVVWPWVAPTKIALSQPVVGTTNLQPPMKRAYSGADAAATAAGHPPIVRSGWRSAAYQQILFDRAVTRYGSRTIAHGWVLLPEESAHVQGPAVDVQPHGAALWLQKHGARYGLCRTYANEWWHFELVKVPARGVCPAMKAHAGS